VSFPTDGGRIAGSISDRSNCFNLNSLGVFEDRPGYVGNPLTEQELALLARTLELRGADAERLAAAAVDWVDADTTPVARGAEDFDYVGLEPPYRAANAPFAEVEEVRALAGVSEADFRALRPYLCAHPVSAPSVLNVNTLRTEDAPLLVAALGGKLDLDVAEDLLAERPAGGWTDADGFWAVEPIQEIVFEDTERSRIGVETRYFELTARVEHRGAVAEGTTLFQRVGTDVTTVSRRIGGRE
jgi:general secretion pathway protein K